MYRPAGESDEDYSDFDEPCSSTTNHHNFNDTPSLSSRLESAIREGKTEEVRIVIKEIGDLSKITLSNGWNAVTFAANEGNYEALQLIINQFPIAEIKDEFTPLMAACSVNRNKIENRDTRLNCIQILLDAGVDINFKDRYGRNALMLASKLGCYYVVEFLLMCQADVDLVDNDGWSALFYAVSGGDEETVEVLTKYNANINIVDKKNRKAYDIAYQKNFHTIAEMIKLETDSSDDEDVQLKSEDPGLKLFKNCEPKFYSDVLNIMAACFEDGNRYAKQFTSNDINLRKFLLLKTDQQLKDLGVTLSLHRFIFLQRIRQFHLCKWSPNSFGLKEISKTKNYLLVDIANFMATLYRQLYVLRTTFMFIKDEIHSSDEKERILEFLRIIQNKLNLFRQKFASIKESCSRINYKTHPLLFAQLITD